MNIIKETYSLGTQSANFSKIIEGDNGLKIKVEIKSDSYDFQSHARVSVFSPTELKWNLVDSIAHSNMKTPSKLYCDVRQQNPNILAPHFVEDTKSLISIAESVLGDTFSAQPVAKKTVSKKVKP